MIPKETIDTIFETARIEEVVGDFVTLKKRGANMLGNCPFHDEKTPSFTVSPTKGIYKCFGCGKGGHAVNFVMEIDQLSYPEALKYLAKKYNIEVQEEEQTPEQIEKANARESLFIVNSYAKDYFQDSLNKSIEGKAVGLSYFKERDVSVEMIDKFQLGYNPDNWDAFTKSALEASYKKEFLEKTGLSIFKDDKAFDRFKGRIIFPIHSISGRIVGFGGRTLKKDDKAKYLNSPESEIYHKSKVLYGIYFSKSAIVKNDNCLIVEGYTDVISMHQSGIENVVASSGTALGTEQIKLIGRYTKNITLLFDSDNAGIKAATKAIDLILAESMTVKIALLPEGEDPDSYAKKFGGEGLTHFINKNSKDFVEFKIALLDEKSKNDPIKKVSLINNIMLSIALIPDGITREVYIDKCSKLLEVGKAELENKVHELIHKTKPVKKAERQTAKKIEQTQTVTKDKAKSEFQEKDIIRFMLQYGHYFLNFENTDNNSEENKVYVVHYIISEFRNQKVFSNPNYSLIFNTFEEALSQGELLTEEYFTQHKDPEISQVAVDIISNEHAISQKWKEHGIYTETEEMQLKKAVDTAIYSLKIAKIVERIEVKTTELANGSENDEKLLVEINDMLTIKREISAKLGRIVLG
ncbi:MAG: DNA primase [Flavobacteriales bacterium]|jgi:DNA primase|nr:DNA primase [Flavobacteriales bacterium]